MIFAHQVELTTVDIKAKLNEFASAIPTLDIKEFEGCVNNQMSLGVVLRDLNLARDNNITATPTRFINGHMTVGVADDERLEKMVLAAQD